MAVLEMEWMGFWMQDTSLGWQDFPHWMISARSTLDLLEERNIQPSKLYRDELYASFFLDQNIASAKGIHANDVGLSFSLSAPASMKTRYNAKPLQAQ